MSLRLVCCLLVIVCNGIIDASHCEVEQCIVDCQTELILLSSSEDESEVPNPEETTELAGPEDRHAGPRSLAAASRANLIGVAVLRLCRAVCHTMYPTQPPEGETPPGDTDESEGQDTNVGEEQSGGERGGTARRRRILASARRALHSPTKKRKSHQHTQ